MATVQLAAILDFCSVRLAAMHKSCFFDRKCSCSLYISIFDNDTRSRPYRKAENVVISNVTCFRLHDDDSFDASALDVSFHEKQAVSSVYQCNESRYKSSFKQNFKRHKHPVTVATMLSQSVSLICDHCGLDFVSRYGSR